MESNGTYLARKRYIKQINIIWEGQKKTCQNPTPRLNKLMSEKNQGYGTGEEGVEVGILLIGNDKNNVIANKVLNCF